MNFLKKSLNSLSTWINVSVPTYYSNIFYPSDEVISSDRNKSITKLNSFSFRFIFLNIFALHVSFKHSLAK